MSALTRTTNIISVMLQEYDNGLLELSISDILKIRASLLSERPVVDHYLTILVNQFEYLSSGFELQDDEKPETISRFLSEFRESLQRELLSQDGTYKDGIALSLSSD